MSLAPIAEDPISTIIYAHVNLNESKPVSPIYLKPLSLIKPKPVHTPLGYDLNYQYDNLRDDATV